MTKAEQRAEAYEKSLDYYHCINDWPSVAFIAGYEQAEKDLGWISVKERLPKEGHYVFTCCNDQGTPQSVAVGFYDSDGSWFDNLDGRIDVDYWMEIPKFNKQ